MFYQKSCAIFTLILLLNTLVFHPSNAEEESENEEDEEQTAPPLSILAYKMQGTCPNPNLTIEYIEACSKSSLSIYSEKDQLSAKTSQNLVRLNAMIKVKQQKDILMAELINRALYKAKVPRHQPIFGLELLSIVMGIYAKSCTIVPATFIQTVYHLFTYIHWLTAHNRKEYLIKKDQKWLSKLIYTCLSNLEMPPVLKDPCSESAFNLGNCTNYICTESEYEFRLMRTDPIVDVVYKAMELVQSVCFPHFKQSYRMFHFFHLAIADLFTEDIKIRWVTQLENFDYWNRLLGPGFQNHFINLERCSEGIIAAQTFHYRIPRNSLPARVRLDGTPQILRTTR